MRSYNAAATVVLLLPPATSLSSPAATATSTMTVAGINNVAGPVAPVSGLAVNTVGAAAAAAAGSELLAAQLPPEIAVKFQRTLPAVQDVPFADKGMILVQNHLSTD
jgi:hypothetical protein